MSRQVGVQEVDPDEHAARSGGQGQLHDDAVRLDQGEPEHQDEGGRGNGPGRRRAPGDRDQGVAVHGQGEDRAPGSDDER